jgi:hypothetical protein
MITIHMRDTRHQRIMSRSNPAMLQSRVAVSQVVGIVISVCGGDGT